MKHSDDWLIWFLNASPDLGVGYSIHLRKTGVGWDWWTGYSPPEHRVENVQPGYRLGEGWALTKKRARREATRLAYEYDDTKCMACSHPNDWHEPETGCFDPNCHCRESLSIA